MTPDELRTELKATYHPRKRTKADECVIAIARADANRELETIGASVGTDFHALSSSQVERILLFAQLARYHKPANANGSTARYYYARLQRTVSLK